MGDLRLAPGEEIRADLTAPFRTLSFPVLELIAWTGIFWIGIGWLDREGVAVDVAQRNIVVLAWFVVLLWRFIVPLLRSRRQRFVITTQRIMVRAPKLRARVESIPLADIRAAQKKRGGVSLLLVGRRRPIYFPHIPKTKRAVELIEESRPQWPPEGW